MADSRLQIATFRIEDQLYGVELGYVQEYVENLSYTLLPDHDNKYVALANLRGQIISLLDLKYLMKGESSQDIKNLMIIRNNRSLSKSKLEFEKHPTSEEAIGFVIEERGQILKLKKSQMSSAPDYGDNKFSKYYKCVITLEEEILILLDLETVIGLNVEGSRS